MKPVLTMTDKLKDELPEMLAEHKQIVAALEELLEVSREEGHPEVVDFAEKLILHAQAEEEVSYPTAILIGEYLKLKLDSGLFNDKPAADITAASKGFRK